jgi:hypothetical protein
MLVVLGMMGGIGRGASSDVEIHCLPKKVDEATKTTGTTLGAKEHWNYEVTIENRTFKDLTGIEVKYVLFYKPEKLGERTEEKMKRQNGNAPFAVLKPHEKKVFKTSAVELKKAQLVNDFYYPTGGRQAAQDTLGGLWVRVYQNGQQIGEYANPSTLMREKWE